MKYTPKLGPYKTRKLLRDELKDIYKAKKKHDAVIGRRMCELTQIWLHSPKEYETKGDKIIVKTTPEAEEALAEWRERKEEKRFREEFPNFAKFRKFVRKHHLSLEELRDG